MLVMRLCWSYGCAGQTVVMVIRPCWSYGCTGRTVVLVAGEGDAVPLLDYCAGYNCGSVGCYL